MNYNESQQLTETATLVREMHNRLFGNGQPGELAKLAGRLNDMDDDIDELKQTKARAHGAMWVLGSLISTLGITEVWHLFKK